MEAKIDEIFVSPEDERKYRAFRLESGLQVMVISDKNTSKAAASLDVRVGSYSDPETANGLAHFCEHMLFLGTKKYLSESEYNTFIGKNGGMNNAYTSNESTNYFFDITWEQLDGALDRFAQFFIEPLFTESAVDRELEAIENEHSKNKQNDVWRSHHLMGVVGSKKHPISKFGTGDFTTLKVHPDIRDRVLNFYKEHYSSHVMKLVVLGRESLEELEKSVREKFSGVQRRNISPQVFNGVPYEPCQLKKLVKFVPVKDDRNLILVFPLPPAFNYYAVQPMHYISFLIGHEGEGSILDCLKIKGWANALCAGPSHEDTDSSIFSIKIVLTDEGANHVDEIVDIIFAYISLIRNSGITPERYEEQKKISHIQFRFKGKQEPINYVPQISSNMQVYPLYNVLSGADVFELYEPGVIRIFLEKLTPDNMNILLSFPEFNGHMDQREKYYDIQYSVNPLLEQQIQRWSTTMLTPAGVPLKLDYLDASLLHLPKFNPFVPENLEILPPPKVKHEYPQIIWDSKCVRMWYLQDTLYKVPKGVLYLSISSPYSYMDPESSVKMCLFKKLLSFGLKKFSYDAEIAGVKFHAINTVKGIQLVVSGYDSMKILLEKIIDQLINCNDFNQEMFDLVKEKTMKDYKNQIFDQPYRIVLYKQKLILQSQFWDVKQYIEVLPSITLDDVKVWSQFFLRNCYIEGLYYGNMQRQEVARITTGMADKINSRGLLAGQHHQQRLVALTRGKGYLMNIICENPNESCSATSNYYQLEVSTDRRLAIILGFIVQVLEAPAFDQLRTVEQLGYLVSLSYDNSCSVEAVNIIIQSSNYDPAYMDSRIEEFLAKAKERYLQSLSSEEFETHRASLIAEKKRIIPNQKEKAAKYWESIDRSKTYNFEQDNRDIEILESLKLEDLLEVYDIYLNPSSTKRAKLSVQMWKQSIKPPSAPKEDVIEDPFILKSTLPLFNTIPYGRPPIVNEQKIIHDSIDE